MRACSACGFKNSVAKNYCDSCGTSLAEAAAPPPPSPSSAPEPPRTLIFGLGKRAPAEAAPAAAPVSADPWSSPAPAAEPAADPRPRWPRARAALNVGAAALGALAAALALARWHSERRPERALPRLARAHLEALRRGDDEAAASLFTERARALCPPAELARRRAGRPAWTFSAPRLERLDPESALLRYELSEGGAPPRAAFLPLVREGEAWRRPYDEALLSRARELLAEGRSEDALAEAARAGAVDPEDPEAAALSCAAARAARPAEEAVQPCLRALELAARGPEERLSARGRVLVHSALAEAYRGPLKDPARAVEHYAHLSAVPGLSREQECALSLSRAKALRELDRLGEAAADLERAAGLCSGAAELADLRRQREALRLPPL